MSTTLPATKAYGAVATVDYGADAGLGTQGIDQSHFTPPMLNILQDLSPTVKDRTHNVKDILNTGSGESYDGSIGVDIVPCAVDRYFTEWKPRGEGGGFLGRHDIGSPVVQKALAESKEFGKLNTQRGTLMETFVIYGLHLTEDGDAEPVVIPFTSTKIKVYKKFVSRLMSLRVNGQKPPVFAHVFRFKTKSDKNAKGEFGNWDIQFAGGTAENSRLDPTSPLYSAARDFAIAATEGSVKTNDAGHTEDVPF